MNRHGALGLLLIACGSSAPPRKPPPRTVAPRPDLAAVPGQAWVLFKAGARFSEQPRWTPDDIRDLEARGENVIDSCRARRDAVDVCARIEPSCVPLPAAQAWSVCSGRGAMCTEEYSREEGARLLAYPPQCTCVCGAERGANNAIDWGKSPPP